MPEDKMRSDDVLLDYVSDGDLMKNRRKKKSEGITMSSPLGM
jgi:hypothetical protein